MTRQEALGLERIFCISPPRKEARKSPENTRQTNPNKRNRLNEEAACLDDKSHRKQLGGVKVQWCTASSRGRADDRKLQEAQNIFILKMFASKILCFHPAAHHGEETERQLGNIINTCFPHLWSILSWCRSQSHH